MAAGPRRRGWSTLWLNAPTRDADRRTRLVFIRDLNVRCLLAYPPVIVFAVLVDAGIATTVVVAMSVLQAINIAWLQYKLARL